MKEFEAPLNPKLYSLIKKVRHDKRKSAVLQFILFDSKKANKITKEAKKQLDKILKVISVYDKNTDELI